MELANQYSFILISTCVVVIIVAALRLLLHWRWRTLMIGALGLSAAAALVFFAARPGTSDVDTLEDADRMLGNGNPTLVEFFSNYCAGCMGVRPAVDSLVSNIRDRYSDRFNILRIDIHTAFGRALRERYGFSFTPEFILLDETGREVWRSHSPPDMETVAQFAAF